MGAAADMVNYFLWNETSITQPAVVNQNFQFEVEPVEETSSSKFATGSNKLNIPIEFRLLQLQL